MYFLHGISLPDMPASHPPGFLFLGPVTSSFLPPDIIIARPPPNTHTHLTPAAPPQVPVALATSVSERRVRPALDKLALTNHFDAVVTAEDNGSAEVEYFYMAAAQQLQRPFVRCIVVGDNNRSVEAAHELGMKSVIVTGGQPSWNYGGADLVVRNLQQLSFVNMKKLFGAEDLVEPAFDRSEFDQHRSDTLAAAEEMYL